MFVGEFVPRQKDRCADRSIRSIADLHWLGRNSGIRIGLGLDLLMELSSELPILYL